MGVWMTNWPSDCFSRLTRNLNKWWYVKRAIGSRSHSATLFKDTLKQTPDNRNEVTHVTYKLVALYCHIGMPPETLGQFKKGRGPSSVGHFVFRLTELSPKRSGRGGGGGERALEFIRRTNPCTGVNNSSRGKGGVRVGRGCNKNIFSSGKKAKDPYMAQQLL